MTRKDPPVHEGSFLSPSDPGPASARLRSSGIPGVVEAISKVATRPALRLVVLILLTIIQTALTAAAFYLVDLTLDLAELWAILARKHLELTL